MESRPPADPRGSGRPVGQPEHSRNAGIGGGRPRPTVRIRVASARSRSDVCAAAGSRTALGGICSAARRGQHCLLETGIAGAGVDTTGIARTTNAGAAILGAACGRRCRGRLRCRRIPGDCVGRRRCASRAAIVGSRGFPGSLHFRRDRRSDGDVRGSAAAGVRGRHGGSRSAVSRSVSFPPSSTPPPRPACESVTRSVYRRFTREPQTPH